MNLSISLGQQVHRDMNMSQKTQANKKFTIYNMNQIAD